MSSSAPSVRSSGHSRGDYQRLQTGRATARRAEGSAVSSESSSKRLVRADLKVLPGKEAIRRRRDRRVSRLLIVASVAVIMFSLLATVAAHSYIAEQQFKLDSLRQTAAEKFTSNQELELHVAQLQQPSRIVGIAQEKLGMLPPSSVPYLSPGKQPGYSTGSGKG